MQLSPTIRSLKILSVWVCINSLNSWQRDIVWSICSRPIWVVQATLWEQTVAYGLCIWVRAETNLFKYNRKLLPYSITLILSICVCRIFHVMLLMIIARCNQSILENIFKHRVKQLYWHSLKLSFLTLVIGSNGLMIGKGCSKVATGWKTGSIKSCLWEKRFDVILKVQHTVFCSSKRRYYRFCMPANPSIPLWWINRRIKVSIWSSCWWAVIRWLTPLLKQQLLQL